MGQTTRDKEFRAAEAASKAHSDLNIFAAIVALLEGGTVSTESDRVAQRIIEICQKHQAACLRRYDRALRLDHRGVPLP